jgi:hypothetical protein
MPLDKGAHCGVIVLIGGFGALALAYLYGTLMEGSQMGMIVDLIE